MTRPTLTPAQTRALMWLDDVPKLVPTEMQKDVRSLRNRPKFLCWAGWIDSCKYWLSFEGLALKATLQREQSVDAGPSDTEMCGLMIVWPDGKPHHVCFTDNPEQAWNWLSVTRSVDADDLKEFGWKILPVSIRAATQSDPSTSAVAAGDNETSRG